MMGLPVRTLPAIVPTPDQSNVALALDAWFDGDFDRVLSTLDEVPVRAVDDEIMARLLRARALLRLSRPAEVQLAIGDIELYRSVDARATAQMLAGAAATRIDGTERVGEAQLRALLADGRLRSMHRSIRAETWYRIAVARYRLDDFNGARASNRHARVATTDIVYAQALALDGWISAAAGDFLDASTRFNDAFTAYRACVARDRYLEATIVVYLEQLRSNLLPVISAALSPCEDSFSELPFYGWQIARDRAWLSAARNDRAAATRLMRLAYELAPSDARRVNALAQRAELARCFGETSIADDFADAGRTLAATVDWPSHAASEHHALPLLAAQVSYTDPRAAMDMLEQFASILGPRIVDTHRFNADLIIRAEDDFAAGIVFRANGANAISLARFRRAAAIYEKACYGWRYASTMIEIDRTVQSDESVAQALVRSNGYPAEAWWLGRLGRRTHAYAEPTASGLSRAEREVLRGLADDKTVLEIALATGRNKKTVSNLKSALFTTYQVDNVRDLLRVLGDRGVYPFND